MSPPASRSCPLCDVARLEIARGKIAERRVPAVRVIPALDPGENRATRFEARAEVRAVQHFALPENRQSETRQDAGP
jgi:hypothetical protein